MLLAIYILSVVAVISSAVMLGSELKRDLMMLQQNSYRRERYLRWLSVSGDTTSLSRLIGLVVLFGTLVIIHFLLPVLILLILYSLTNSISLLKAKYKKPLVVTARVKRLMAVDLAIVLILALGGAVTIGLYYSSFVLALLTAAIIFLGEYCGSHIITLLSLFILSPVEKSINARYYNEAKVLLTAMPDLKVIGITGSYGKTSTKHYLHTILSEQFETVMTPGSFNTTLGVIITIREHLKPYTEVFIVEMGAKQRGDIKEICDLVHPSIGIVTAVGNQHLESFGSIENIQSTKFELIDALPSDGLAVINNDFEKIADRQVVNVQTIRYAIKTGSDVNAQEIEVDFRGSRFVYVHGDIRLAVSTKLVGKCNISNLIAAITVATYLGMSQESIIRGIKRIEQVEHRLSIRRGNGGIIIIDDAFNSNPVGAEMALEVLSSVKGGRRIVITPGMIELGDSQYDENYKLGQTIASSADVAIIVGEYNRAALKEGIAKGDGNPEVIQVDTFTEAQRQLAPILKSGDIILYENDLPDTFK